MKALSVTDLVSPSWCELQYWYVLTKHGRKRRTPAMKQGSTVHKKLEDEVHTTVSVNITTKEDSWGLRIWNMIQGLRTLRETGMTRELELWAVIDGQVVNGIIDELSYNCPDQELESSASHMRGRAKEAQAELPEYQMTITDFMNADTKVQSSESPVSESSSTPVSVPTARKIYLTDIKTRSSKSFPKGASFRPSLIQLLLYHRMLTSLVTKSLDAEIIFKRYSLDPTAPFTDAFLAQIGSLNEFEPFHPPSESPMSSQMSNSSSDTLSVLLAHNSLHSLWSLLHSQLALTFPQGADSVGDVLAVEYRHSTSGEIMGYKAFLNDKELLERYLKEEMEWWRGERYAVGVSIEEAYKCRSCEFAESCQWRAEKIQEAVERVRGGREEDVSRSVV